MKKNKILLVAAMVVLLFVIALSGCAQQNVEKTPCDHIFLRQDCNSPRKCLHCNETEGEPVGHSWIPASCQEAKHCFYCKITEGEKTDHDWRDATCRKAKHCYKCDLVEGEPLEHVWTEATCTTKKTCTLCKKTEGEVNPHNYVMNSCADCGETLASNYKELVRYLNSNYSTLETPLGTVTGITFSIDDHDPPLYCTCDYVLNIETSLYVKDVKHSLDAILGSDYYAYEDRVQTLMAMIEYAHEVSRIAMEAFPDKKMKGSFYDWGYKYPTIKEGFWSISYLSFSNYDKTENVPSHWRMNEYAGDSLSDYFSVTNQLKQDVASRMPYDITFKIIPGRKNQ